jgi:hypothetical protein
VRIDFGMGDRRPLEMPMPRRLMICSKLPARDLRHASFSAESPRQARRMQAIANAIDGMTRSEAGRLADMSDQALVDAIKRYNNEGIAGLTDRPRTGRPAKFDAIVRTCDNGLAFAVNLWHTRSGCAFFISENHADRATHAMDLAGGAFSAAGAGCRRRSPRCSSRDGGECPCCD